MIVAEDWNAYMYLYVRALSAESEFGRTIAIIYFITLFVVGNTIMLALFTALLLKSGDADIDILTRHLEEKETKKVMKSGKDETPF